MESDDLLNKKLNMSIPKAGNPTLRKAKSVRRKDLKEKHENDKDESSSSSEEEIMESDDLLTKKLNMSIQKAGNPTPKESATSLGGKEAHQPGKEQEDSSSSSEEEMMASEDLLTKKLNMSTPKEKETGKNPFINFISAKETKVNNMQEKAKGSGSSSSSEEEMMDNLLSKKLDMASTLTGIYKCDG